MTQRSDSGVTGLRQYTEGDEHMQRGKKAQLFLLKDVSASMGAGQHLLADSVFWQFEEELQDRYPDVETTYLLFDVSPVFVGQDEFYGPKEGSGGCGAAAAMERVAERLALVEGDTYLLMAGDGFYADDGLYDRLEPVEPDTAAHLAVYAEQEAGVETFRADLDERWTYDRVVGGPDDVTEASRELETLLSGDTER